MAVERSNNSKYSIGEAAKIAGLEPHVLRFWESEFKELSPKKNNAGRRIYRQADIDIVLQLKDLLHHRKFTIEGAKNILHGKSEGDSQAEFSFDDVRYRQVLVEVRSEIEKIMKMLDD